MKTNKLTVSRFSWLLILGVIAFACEKENENMLTEKQMEVQAEESAKVSSQMMTAAHDVTDITAGAMAKQGVSNGRLSTGRETHPDTDCEPSITASFSLDRTHTDTLIYNGVLTIDFGTGVLCADSSEVHKGKIIDSLTLLISYKDSVVFDQKQLITFYGFQKDSVKIDGTFTTHATSEKVSSMTISHATLTYPDGTASHWQGTLTTMYYNGENMWSKKDDSKEVTGSLEGTNRQGVNFSSMITQPVLFNFSCNRKIPVKGIIKTTVGNAASTVDFGDGTCDKVYTIETAGTTTEYTFHTHHAD